MDTPRNRPWVIDVEASGFGAGSYPIEVGYVAPDGSAFCTLIRPEPDWRHWDASAEQVHRLDRGLLQTHGRGACEVAERLNQALAGRSVYCNSWAHDYVWLARLFDAAERPMAFRLRDVRELLDEAQLARFDTIKAEVQARTPQPRHRASADARVIQDTLAALLC